MLLFKTNDIMESVADKDDIYNFYDLIGKEFEIHKATNCIFDFWREVNEDNTKHESKVS